MREAVARIRAGDSLRAMAADWNERGVATVRGAVDAACPQADDHWPRLSAQREYKGEIVAAGDWQPILTPQETAHLRAILGNPER